ncbi:mechanosensitive ion channel family protein [Diaminobutyricimonas sp. LJ205]|uniref:mechanosensitive ion channel family protein n=1 Tax=Diaminobutyricimonas sp. LJ205 TaxID=2683590 RepID=UPI0012F4EAD6|nr:mechanosensitive ion channel family protein [Diaminobutyricimonas sp. LJ205]
MFEWRSWPGVLVAIGIALVAAIVVIVITAILMRTFARHKEWPKPLMEKARLPFRLLIVTIALWPALALSLPGEALRAVVAQVLSILVIIISAWLLSALLSFVIGQAMTRYRIDVADNRVARRVHTQLTIVRRLGVALIVVIALAAVLLTFPGVRTVGASILASAGVISIIAGLAAQSTLGNVFAGVQLAFSDALRVDDVVIAEGQWGRIEEMTLTYVVVKIWDDRRLVLPSTYFTTTPFENWTRSTSDLIGSVELDLDWQVPVQRLRDQLDIVLTGTDLWDGRTAVLQVTDAIGGLIRIRVLVSASDAGRLFDLRCIVREELVEFVRVEADESLPRQRFEVVREARTADVSPAPIAERPGLFSGSPEAEERAHEFTQSIPIVNADATR